MAAITVNLEQQDEVSELESKHSKCAGGRRGRDLQGLDAADSCPDPREVLADQHAQLLNTNWAREAAEDSLVGREIRISQGVPGISEKTGNPTLSDQRTVYMMLDDPAGKVPLWNPPGDGTAQKFELLSWTSKMDCPSWSLPAGHMSIGGSCPAAAQSVLDDHELHTIRKQAEKLTGPFEVVDTICNTCYATGGQYQTGMVQFAQVLRYAWAKVAVYETVPGSSDTYFYQTMMAAIENANFFLGGGKPRDQKWVPPEPKGRRQKYFRLHDSGDFWSKDYFFEWLKICTDLPKIRFWAPTRIHMMPGGRSMIREAHAKGLIPRNLVIRPSAYLRNAPPVDLDLPIAAPTVVIHKDKNRGMTDEREESVTRRERSQVRAFLAKRGKSEKHLSLVRAPGGPDARYSWDCRAYAVKDGGHTCRRAFDIDSKKPGCRVCWDDPDEIINYTLH